MPGFGVSILQEGLEYDRIRGIALEAERLGFDAAWISDHFFFSQKPYFECWTTLSSLASQTERLRLGTLVLCNSYRHPSLLAKMAATLDVISNGRLELGIGAGWHKEEFSAYGVPYEPHSVRTAKLIEGIEVIKKLWNEESITFEGKYYSLKNAVCLPKPVQKPRPRIWVGGSSKKTLRIAAQHADGFNASFPHFFTTPQEFGRVVRLAESFRSQTATSSPELQKSISLVVMVAKSKEEVKEEFRKALAVLRRYGSWRVNLNVMKRAPRRIWTLAKAFFGFGLPNFMLAGTPERCAEIIRSYTNSGATYFQLIFPGAYIGDFTSMRVFAEQVMPSFLG